MNRGGRGFSAGFSFGMPSILRLRFSASNVMMRRDMHQRNLLYIIAFGCFVFPALALAENWPQFRGPTGQGESSEKNLPLTWSTAENVLWKTEVSGWGWSSPIVWGDRVFLTSTTQDGVSCHVISCE